MLDKEKVRLMTELAFYEQNQGKEDFKINEYYRKDYAGLHMLCSILWVTLGYACIVGIGVIIGLEYILANISEKMIITMVLVLLVGYIAVVLLYALIGRYVFDRKHRMSRKRLKKYNYNLTRLLKMYEKENDNE